MLVSLPLHSASVNRQSYSGVRRHAQIDMTEEEFDTYVDRCFELVETQNALLVEKYGLGKFDSWSLDQTENVLSFSDGTHRDIAFKVDAIGSLSKDNWLWAWANTSLTENIREASNRMISLFDETGYEIFRMQRFKADETMAWELSGMALDLIGGLGTYRCPSSESHLFVVVREVLS